MPSLMASLSEVRTEKFGLRCTKNFSMRTSQWELQDRRFSQKGSSPLTSLCLSFSLSANLVLQGSRQNVLNSHCWTVPQARWVQDWFERLISDSINQWTVSIRLGGLSNFYWIWFMVRFNEMPGTIVDADQCPDANADQCRSHTNAEQTTQMSSLMPIS